ncbi:MAG: glycerol-3-phosphate 1-O-acyltransferase PlsY [bacterium]
MNTTIIYLLFGSVAYLMGSIPFGFLIAKTQGIDIRKVGSGNIGATNVFRSISKKLGVLTFALDFFKGCCGAALLPFIVAHFAPTPLDGWAKEVLPVFCGALTIVGHNWTCFLGFKGGKGIATSAGMLIGLSPIAVTIGLAVWFVIFFTTRYVSVASICAALTLGIIVWPLHLIYLKSHGVWFPTVLTLLACLAIWKHRSNIARLRAGTESRFEFGKKRHS